MNNSPDKTEEEIEVMKLTKLQIIIQSDYGLQGLPHLLVVCERGKIAFPLTLNQQAKLRAWGVVSIKGTDAVAVHAAKVSAALDEPSRTK